VKELAELEKQQFTYAEGVCRRWFKFHRNGRKSFLTWRQRWQVAPKRWETSKRQHGITSQMSVISMVITGIVLYLTYLS